MGLGNGGKTRYAGLTEKRPARGDRSGSEVQSQADGSNLVGFFAS